MTKRRAWLAGAFAAVLAGGLVATWNAGEPRFEGSLARAASRHRATAPHPEAIAEPIRPAADPPPDPPPAVQIVPKGVPSAPKPPPDDPLAFILDAPDVPQPPATPAFTLDDLFPPLPRGAPGAPCFDKLQGIGGLSPCPNATPRGP